MTEYVFSCRIDGRAGYVRLWGDALELLRSGRRRAGEPEFVWLGAVTRVATGKPGWLFTGVQLVADGVTRELTFPAADAPRVAELIEALVAAQAQPVEPDPPASIFSAPAEPTPTEASRTVDTACIGEAPAVDFSTVEVPEFELPDLTNPQGTSSYLAIVAPEMPEWTTPPEEAGERLSRLEVLRNCGIVADADFAQAEAEILEVDRNEVRSA